MRRTLAKVFVALGVLGLLATAAPTASAQSACLTVQIVVDGMAVADETFCLPPEGDPGVPEVPGVPGVPEVPGVPGVPPLPIPAPPGL